MANEIDNKINEKELLYQAKNGSLAAFEKILFLYEKPIYNYVYRLTGRKEDAEDLTQKTFIKLFKSLKTINLDKSFKSWLYKIATNTAYDWFRQRKRETEFLVEEPGQYFETIEADDPYYSVETAELLDQALGEIKTIYRSVILLYYKDGLTYQEVADTLQIPINTVKTHLRRAKLALKNQLTKNI
jgi:RNA polymerase sigma-70 factor (ECF subfamily)